MPKIFISYNHQDNAIKDRLITHLGVLQQQGLVESWDDQQIPAGANRKDTIRQALHEAQVAVLLISADYLSSDLILNEEVPDLLRRRSRGDLHLFPIVVRPCPWSSAGWLQEMQILEADTGDPDRIFSKVAEDIYRLVGGEAKQQTAKSHANGGSLAMLNSNLPIYLEIDWRGGAFGGIIHQGNPEEGHQLNSLELDKKTAPFESHDGTIEQVVAQVSNFGLQDLGERLQLEMGHYLYDQTLGHLPDKFQRQLLQMPTLDLRIATSHEWIAQLPWQLLAHKGIFRSASGWSIALSGPFPEKECQLAPSPRILIVAPEPTNAPQTDARSHLEALEDQLSASHQQLTRNNNLWIVTSWEELTKQVESFQPEIVYFYGNAVSDQGSTSLLFADGGNKKVAKSLSDFGQCLRRGARPPLLVYLNLCGDHEGASFGDAHQLGGAAPAVLVSRVKAQPAVLQDQAQAILFQVLVQAIPPHQAINNLSVNFDLNQLSTTQIRWSNPVLYRHYRSWQATLPTHTDRLTKDPNWHLKVDRVSQYSLVMTQTRLMLREQKPRSLVFTWYGEEGQGIEIFHKRLLVELREDLHHAFVHQVRPAWPMHLENYHTSFSNMMMQAFQVNALEDIPARIRAASHGTYGKQTLVYIRHEPISSARLINPETLKEYICWWDAEMASILDRKQFALLSTSFIVNDPPAFAEYIEDEYIDEVDLKKTVFWLLDEMEKVARKDLLLFLKTHNIDLPRDRKDKVLQKILRKTGGRYEQTIEELKNLRQEAWSQEEKEQKPKGKKKYEY